jgi:hypothetical protein
MSTNDVHYFGIRHHGPGSAKRLAAALEQLQPQKVLIEGPTDCSELLPMLAQHDMQPPVALLAYAAEDPACSIYYPFAEFSPEYQACLWAVKNNVELAFIDLPVAVQLAQSIAEQKKSDENEDEKSSNELEETDSESNLSLMHYDPIGALAHIAGYDDGEAWWNDFVEQNNDDDLGIFSTVESAMQALRDKRLELKPFEQRELQREAHMRLEIAKAKKTATADIAVVCGAWHVPAFREKHSAKADRELLKSLATKLPKSKLKTTWIPWTSPRLATASGYGAGVDAPMWYLHLWHSRNDPHALETWLANVSHALRKSGQIVSTASVIEAVRLSQGLAAVRGRPSPGFEEIREAVIACLCFGEQLIWQQLEKEILQGNQVGTIPENAPLIPLVEDLQRLQKKNKLKPEALEKEISLDLRADAGLGKSTLLHRLSILDVPWGRLADAGKSRGTFRERWSLKWQPEFSIRLIENLVYGSTLEQAANNKVSEQLRAENNLSKLAQTVQRCLESQLNSAADIGLLRLNERAAHTSDAIDLLDSLAPLVDINRYGTAREMSLGQIGALIDRLTVQAALSLPYACRNLNDEEANHFRRSFIDAHQAVQLSELDSDITQQWWQSLQQIVDSSASSLQISGLAARLLYQANYLSADALKILLEKMLSPAVLAADAARFFEGFFTEAVQRLLYDDLLLSTVESWLTTLDEDAFIEFLPLFRRVFSALDAMERKRMIDTILDSRENAQTQQIQNPNTIEHWPQHLQRIGKLIQRDKAWTQ